VIDLGAAAALFAAGGAIIVAAMLLGLASGLAGRMDQPVEEAALSRPIVQNR
jgi:hypothetical protein